MKKIKLRGSFLCTTVDDIDYEILKNREWVINSSGYVTQMRKDNSPKIYLNIHREIMKPEKAFEVDHKDGNKLNNCRNNLRVASHAENMRNRHKKCYSSSKYKGVHRINIRGHLYWNARIKLNGHSFNLGTYRNELEAALAYNKASIEFHGEFSSLNDININI